MTQSEFEVKWQYKIVKPSGHYKIPDKEYAVTACLLDSYISDTMTKFAIIALDYSLENKHWICLDLAPEEVEKLDERFEIIGEYTQEQVAEIISRTGLNFTAFKKV